MGQTYTNDGPRVNMVNSKLWRLSFSCSNLIVVKQIQMLIRMKIIICLDMIILSYVQHPPYLNKVKKVQCLEPLFRALREKFLPDVVVLVEKSMMDAHTVRFLMVNMVIRAAYLSDGDQVQI